MKMRNLACALAAGIFCTTLHAQSTLDFPVGERQPYLVDSGVQANANDAAASVFEHTVRVENGAWIRVHFDTVQLSPGSFVRVTSLLDNEVQELDLGTMRMWGNSTAYFNGDSVHVELIAAPGAKGDRFIIKEIERAKTAHAIGGGGQCGICGADDRVPSMETWSARMFPAGCTASVYNVDSCMVSAGHCVSGGDVVQFNVPLSDPNCSTNNPPIADQFPIVMVEFVNGGVGNDWSVLVPGTNNLGQLPFERYGEMRPIAGSPAGAGAPVAIWGYGVDLTCTVSQTQQTSGGNITAVAGSWYEFNVDVRGGNSGSALINNGQIIAVVTHCSFGCPNFGTRVDLPTFANSIATCAEGGGTGPCNENAGDCCSANGTPGCNQPECCASVCAADPFCCDVAWDSICADEALADPDCICGQGPCNANAGDCCSANGTPGCNQPDCCASVCAADPFCCDIEWDQICADAALTNPACDCGPDPTEACCFPDGNCSDLTPADCSANGGTPQGPGSNCATTSCPQPSPCGDKEAGDCCVPNGSPGCEVAGCCESVCAADPFCCDVEWDQLCADGAAADPNCDCAPPCPWDLNGDGLVNAADLGILLGAWGNPYDAGDLAALLGDWGPC